MSNNEEPKRETAKEKSEKLVSNFISSKTREELDRYTKNYMEKIKKECEEI